MDKRTLASSRHWLYQFEVKGAIMLIPIYQEQGHTFQADTCAPLDAAVRRGHVQFAALARGHYPGRKLRPRALPSLMLVTLPSLSRKFWATATFTCSGCAKSVS